MRSRGINKSVGLVQKSSPYLMVATLIIGNFLIRLLIYFNTRTFYFSDYSTYLNVIEKIARGENQYLLQGNFLFALSYIGYFAKHVLGNIDYFFIFNCFIGSLTSLILYMLITKISGLPLAGIMAIIIHSLYTEFMVFSSVFYTPVIMIFLLSLIILIIWYFLTTQKKLILISSGTGIIILYLLTFFFKPELKYLPYFLIVSSIFLIKRDKRSYYKINGLAAGLILALFVFNKTNVLSQPEGNVISNEFVFFGHTDYGGDGGEGSFVYKRNQQRYEAALAEYSKSNNVVLTTVKDHNNFRRQEIKNFIKKHPFEWIGIQFTKFFRTFGVVPESTSFKILYTGLFNNELWITAVIVVAPVALIILLFIFFFSFAAIKQLFYGHIIHGTQHKIPGDLKPHAANHVMRSTLQFNHSGFFIIYLIFFIYYLIATIFFGHYQERYRLPLMVVFIIPMLAYFIANFEKRHFFNRQGLILKCIVIVLFLSIWIIQARKAINNKERLINAIESVGGSLDKSKK